METATFQTVIDDMDDLMNSLQVPMRHLKIRDLLDETPDMYVVCQSLPDDILSHIGRFLPVKAMEEKIRYKRLAERMKVYQRFVFPKEFQYPRWVLEHFNVKETAKTYTRIEVRGTPGVFTQELKKIYKKSDLTRFHQVMTYEIKFKLSHLMSNLECKAFMETYKGEETYTCISGKTYDVSKWWNIYQYHRINYYPLNKQHMWHDLGYNTASYYRSD